jgi:16S rRNA (guanine(966)-N(2))-methyltransferase RsmD
MADQVKEAIFNILGKIEGLKVLDLFAGTGNLGIEALSRGASEVCFIDNNPEAIRLIKINSSLISEPKNITVLKASAKKGIQILSNKKKKFDLIFVTPPYGEPTLNKLLLELCQETILAPLGILVVEHLHKHKLSDNIEKNLKLFKKRQYGQTMVSFYENTKEYSHISRIV